MWVNGGVPCPLGAWAAWRGGKQEVLTVLSPHQRYVAVRLWEAKGPHSGAGGAQFEVLGTAGAGLVVPGPARRLGSSGSQVLGHTGAAGSLGRAENKVGSLACWWAVGLGLAWWWPWLGVQRGLLLEIRW